MKLLLVKKVVRKSGWPCCPPLPFRRAAWIVVVHFCPSGHDEVQPSGPVVDGLCRCWSGFATFFFHCTNNGSDTLTGEASHIWLPGIPGYEAMGVSPTTVTEPVKMPLLS